VHCKKLPSSTASPPHQPSNPGHFPRKNNFCISARQHIYLLIHECIHSAIVYSARTRYYIANAINILLLSVYYAHPTLSCNSVHMTQFNWRYFLGETRLRNTGKSTTSNIILLLHLFTSVGVNESFPTFTVIFINVHLVYILRHDDVLCSAPRSIVTIWELCQEKWTRKIHWGCSLFAWMS